MLKYSIEDLDLFGKKVFLRLDLNLPLDKHGKISDTTRLQKSLPTIKRLLEKKAKVVIFSHLGRPQNREQKFSLRQVALKIEDFLKQKVIFAPEIEKTKLAPIINNLQNSEVVLAENTRFYPQEKANDPTFCKSLASLFDLYINDSFGTIHRKEASNYGIAKCFATPSCGFLVQTEIQNLSKLLQKPAQPFVAILGGAKIKDKIPLIQNLIPLVDTILIGGGMAYTFLKARGETIGNSIVDNSSLDFSKELLKNYGNKICLPSDHIVTNELKKCSDFANCDKISAEKLGVDLGQKTIKKYKDTIKMAKTIFWNGPLGVTEIKPFDNASNEIAKAVAKSNSFSVIGGGDSVLTVTKLGIQEKISHISTGGGAALEFIANKELPGISVLKNK